MSSPFTALPVEIILSVISFAAKHQPTALALSLVSSWVRKYVEPALYHTVRLRSTRALASFISTLDGKPVGFAVRTVKKLCITALGPISRIQAVLSKCTGVASLASGFSAPSYVHCVRSQPGTLREEGRTMFRCLPVTPKEQHLLSLACRDGLDMAIISPAVSHLRIQLTSAVTSESFARLTELRQLTHLALVYNQGLSGGLDAIRDMLQPIIEGGKLRVLVLQVAGGAGDTYLEEIRNRIKEERRWSKFVVDGRSSDLIVSASKAPVSFLSEWEESVEFWQRAEDSISGSVIA
ncbi:hypothetical protein J3R83DRAFT_3538 [Lanmaoa asiatica]|nr:hypothetical protein J3R83DRAFT_3538 [Lanmaoa asiatica]